MQRNYIHTILTYTQRPNQPATATGLRQSWHPNSSTPTAPATQTAPAPAITTAPAPANPTAPAPEGKREPHPIKRQR